MKSNAPKALKTAFYGHKLNIEKLIEHPEWVEWLYGEEDYVRQHCTLSIEFYEWLDLDKEKIPDVVENYLVLFFEERAKEELIMDYLGDIDEKKHLEGLFRERNSDMFFDDLPYCNIVSKIEDRDLTMEDVFNLNEEERDLLKDKNLAMGFDTFRYQALFRVFGGRLEDFELYKKYRGIIDIVAYNLWNEKPVELVKDKEILIKRIFLDNVGKRSDYRYSSDVPYEFREEHSEFFLDDDAPSKLKDIFYNSGTNIIGCDTLDFNMLKAHPEYIPFLKGKDIRHCMDWANEYEEFFDFCGNQDLAMELGIKYGNYVNNLKLIKLDEDDKEKIIAERIYSAIIDHLYRYNEDMPEYFKNKYPELFLDENAPEELKEKYYSKKASSRDYYQSDSESKNLNFDFLRENTSYIPFLKGKELRGIMSTSYRDIWELCGGDRERFLSVGLEYGNVLVHPQLRGRIDDLVKYKLDDIKLKKIDVVECLDETIGEAIKDKELLVYDDKLPMHLQRKYPELFLFPEELEEIMHSINRYENREELDYIKDKFYKRCISFKDLYSNDSLKEIIRHKNIDRCMEFYKAGDFFRAFSEVLGGDFDKAYNMAVDRYSNQLSSILYGYVASSNISKVIEFYKQAKFIPHPSVFNKLPEEKIKGFALNKKLWAELMKISKYNSNDEYIGSLLELAVVMGVFETKEVIKNGQVMLHGVGEEGFEKLQELINYVPEFFEVPTLTQRDIEDDTYLFSMHGYAKSEEDYKDALNDRMVRMIFSKEGLLDELRENLLTDYDMKTILNSYMSVEDVESFFSKDSEGKYHYIIDKNSNIKVQKLLKTVGIKKDRWLTQEEFDLIKSCNSEFIARAFVKEQDGYRFNMSKQEQKYVIGKDIEITEEQSRANKKLFDYVRFLMEEYSMEEEAARLGANNDRSNIDLVLDNEKMDSLLRAANWVSKRASDKYVYCDLYKLNPMYQKYYKFLSGSKLHQLFEGLSLEYRKEFRDFIFENKHALINDDEMIGFMKDLQEKIKELSQDPDYAGIKITPEVLIKSLVSVDNQYSNRKSGFEKGEELATKFSFNQEYFDYAQCVWEEARKREASSIPRIEGIENGYSYEVLRLDDAEGIYIGNLTDCCQRLGGVGETSMLHSMTEKNGRVFVVRDSDKRVVAQAWLWRNGNTICFDNVEIPNRAKGVKNEKAIYEILKIVAKKMCDKDAIEVEKLVRAGKISKKKAVELKARKVTVGKGHNDINAIVYNNDSTLEDTEIKTPIEIDKAYKGIYSRDKLYVDSRHQVILYQDKRYVSSDSTIAIHQDDNKELSYNQMRYRELKMMKSIIKEVEGECDFETREDLLKQYDIEEDALKLVEGTDWFMLYSEKDDEVIVHKMLKSPSSGIMKKSIKEQRQAVQMLMDKGKAISMEFENDRVHRAAKSMVRHMQKRYSMKVADEGKRMQVSEISQR